MSTSALRDPDFVPSKGGMSVKELLGMLSPQIAFVGGIILAFLVLMAAGFLAMLPLGVKYLRGQVVALPDKATAIPGGTDVAVPTPLNPSPPSAPAAAAQAPALTKSDHIRGDKNAPLTLIEYSDYECPFCKRFHPTVLQVLEAFKGQVKLVYRHFPLSFHANAQKEAEAAECAGELGGNDAFWNYTDKIFERTASNGTGFALEALVPLAKELGLNESKFKQCLDSSQFTQYVRDQMNAGAEAGVNGTPGSFLVDKDGRGQLISGAVPFEEIKSIIAAKLR